MKKKYWIVFIIVATAIVAAIVVFIIMYPKVSRHKSFKSRELELCPADKKEMIVGLWQIDNHIFYRFNSDGTGRTWDVNDDLTEDEASEFQWEAFKESILVAHKLKFRGVIPRYYEFEIINEHSLRFSDSYSTQTLYRVKK